MMHLELKRRVTGDQVRRKRRLEDRLARRTRSIFAGIRRDLVETFPALDALPALRPHQNSLQAELETHYRLVQREFESDLPRQLGGSLPDGALPVIGAGLAAWIVRRSTFQADVIITTVRKRRDRAVAVARSTLQQQAPGDIPAQTAIARTAANVMAPVMRRQANTVGQTETQGAAESTKLIAARALSGQSPEGTEGIPPVPADQAQDLIKTWFTEQDDRVRPHHADAEGQRRNVEEAFTVNEQSLMFPGDTNINATLGNIVNCRCTSLYQPRA